MITMINDSTRRSAVALAMLIMFFLMFSGCAGKNGAGVFAVKKFSQNNPNEKTD